MMIVYDERLFIVSCQAEVDQK